MEKIFKSAYPYIKTIVITGLTVFLIRHFLFNFVVITGTSMEPTYKDGQYAVSSIISKDDIQRFDVVCIDISETTGRSGYYIVKRVIGLPGETVKYENNRLYINNAQVEEPFLSDEVITEDFTMTAGQDEIIVLGDNRPHSSDSRTKGPLKKNKVISKGIYPVFRIARTK